MNRIKNKNFKEICIAIKNRIKRYSFLVSKPIIDLFPVSNKIICFESEPDFSDNSFAFYYFASQKNAFEGYKIVWFLHNLENRKQARGG